MKKLLSLSLILVILFAFLTSCTPAAQTSPTPAATPTPEGTQQPTPEGEDRFPNKELDVAIFEGGFGDAYWLDIIAQFEAAYPGVKVNANIDPEIGPLLATQIAVGEWPDFISLSDTERSGVVASMIKNNQLLDLTDLFNGEALDRPSVKLRDIIIPGMLESTKYDPYQDGRIYLAPFSSSPMGLVYNKTLFAEKGWKLPETWDDFFALNEELKKPENFVTIDGTPVQRSLFTYQGIYPGYLESLLWPALAGSGGLSTIKAIGSYQKGSFSTPEVKAFIEVLAKIGTEGYLMSGSTGLNHTQSQTDMMLGKALFIPNGTWMEGEMADAPREEGFAFAILATPAMKAGDSQYVLSSYEQLEIPKDAKNPELAKEFLRFLYTEASVISFAKNANGTMAIQGVGETAKEYLTSGVYGMFSAFDSGKFMLMNFDPLPADSKVSVGDVVFETTMTDLMNGKLSVDQYIQKVEDAFAQIRADIAAAQ